MNRRANAVWRGDLRSGKGTVDTQSKVLVKAVYSFATRFENETGTNPEELLAAAHAGCYAMAFANTLAKKGYEPEKIEVTAECTLEQQDDGFAITHMKLDVDAVVPNIDSDTLTQMAQEADRSCPVSKLLRPGLRIDLATKLSEQGL
ncbi:MAG: OsmC family protein [Chloroflexota bacterium]